MIIKECMTKKVNRLTPEAPIGEVAKLMSRDDIGAVLINEGDRLVGVVTDRDIVTRAIAEGWTGTDPISSIMTTKVLYCYEDDSIEDVAKNMAKNQVHRLAVIDKGKRLVGIVSLGDLSIKGSKKAAADALCAISESTRH
jgi:CBS domain-containing protein